MKLDPLSLQLFVSVIEEGTVAAAAARHHMAAAAVSKRISELEFQPMSSPGLADSDQRSAAIRPTDQRRYHALGGSIARKVQNVGIALVCIARFGDF